ncbi:caspase family protein [Mesorhizobium sp.]|uniref:caspase family protein n=1 Tax=Mesorhizobium sp. TaxID=1871066 RepID=UPI000FE4F390|nr:caspase family protein [Mesorhizobium sp.]RWA68879.1 MAG: caspase family protein [Mesorhizobium sp.]RWA80744.1 MAG: caspase family protein [Mesorhizobium sp.]
MAGGKYALVVGNAAYSGEMALTNPCNDVRAMHATLVALNFQVTKLEDATLKDMKESIDGFVDRLKTDRASVGLFYFSGHGLQIDDQNYVVPVDFDKHGGPLATHMVAVQPLIEKMSSDVTLVLLDACRNNPGAQREIGTRGLSNIDDARALLVGGRIENTEDDAHTVSGLTAMKVDPNKNIFIAFAAAPGGFAYDGSGQMSPFTQALVANIDAVDLPLFNLTLRVRQEVLAITKDKQRTWDNSSLTDPFFFNPGSLLLFFGNIMALFGLLLSFIPYSLLLATWNVTWKQLAAAIALPLISLAILLFGMQSVYSRLRGNFKYTDATQTTVRSHLLLSLQKGGIGGYLGAQLAALWISVPYFLAWSSAYSRGTTRIEPESLGVLTLEIAIAAALISCLLGIACIFLTRVTWSNGRLELVQQPTSRRILLGTLCGGMLTGLVTAPVLMAYFGSMNRPEVTPEYLLPGSIIGASIIIFSIVNFDFERLNAKRMGTSALAALAALACGGLAAVVVFGPLYALGIVQYVTHRLEQQFDDPVVMISGAAAYGLPVGLILGAVIGAAITLTERWSARPVI